MDEQQIQRYVIEALAEVAPEADARALDPKISFRDQFEVDSVDFLGFVLKLEERFGVTIPEADYPKLSTMEGCVQYLAPQAAG